MSEVTTPVTPAAPAPAPAPAPKPDAYSRAEVDDLVAAAVAKALAEQNAPRGPELSPEERKPARQLTPEEQQVYNKTRVVPDTDAPYLTSDKPRL